MRAAQYIFSGDPSAYEAVANKQTLAYLWMAKLANNKNTINLTPSVRRSVIKKINSKSKDPLGQFEAYLEQLKAADLVRQISDRQWFIEPLPSTKFNKKYKRS